MRRPVIEAATAIVHDLKNLGGESHAVGRDEDIYVDSPG